MLDEVNDGSNARQPHESMNRSAVLAIIDRLLSEAMRGTSRLNPLLLLVARALILHVEEPARIWTVREVACEAVCSSDAIARKRKALLDGTPISSESTFDVAEDSWVCYLALEAVVKEGRAFLVEILEPYAYDDCGYVVDVNVVSAMPTLADGQIQQWVVDLENVEVIPLT